MFSESLIVYQFHNMAGVLSSKLTLSFPLPPAYVVAKSDFLVTQWKFDSCSMNFSVEVGGVLK